MKNKRKRKRIFSGGPITFFDNLRRYSEFENPAVCEICKEESRALRQCRECAFVFCGPCMARALNMPGPMAGALEKCPDCAGINLSDVVF